MYVPTVALSGPTFSNSENCCGSENAMPPKFFWNIEGHSDNFMSKNLFFSLKTYFENKFIINQITFLIFR